MQDRNNRADSAQRKGLLLIVISVVIAHASLLLLEPINFEHSFAEAAEYFRAHDEALIQEYFAVQANTVGMPYLTALVSHLLPGVPLLQVMRLIVLMGVPLLANAILRVCRTLGRDDGHLVTAYILLNPLVWIYAGRATADFFPMALGIWGISLALQPSVSVRRAIVSGCAVGVAAALKYHTAFLAIVVAAYHLRGTPRTWPIRASAAFLASVGIPLAIYIVAAHSAFGFWLTPPEFQTKHAFTPAGFVSNLICYAGYLVLLAMPTLVFIPEIACKLLQRWPLILLLLVTALAFGFFGIADNGEMNLGPADRWVSPGIRTAAFAAMALGLAIPLWIRRPESSRGSVAIWGSVFGMLVIFSLTRPAQRYLLFALPLVVALLPERLFSHRKTMIMTLSAFVLANAFIEYSRACTGVAAARMAEKVAALGLAPTTDLGAITGHVGLYIDHTPPVHTEYVVMKGLIPNAVAVAQAGFESLPSTFSLVRIPPTVKAAGS